MLHSYSYNNEIRNSQTQLQGLEFHSGFRFKMIPESQISVVTPEFEFKG